MSGLVLIGRRESIAFDGTDFILTGFDCSKVETKRHTYKIPGRHGEISDDAYLFRRTVKIEGVIVARSGTKTLSQCISTLERVTAPDTDMRMYIGEKYADVYTESFPEYIHAEYFNERTGAIGFRLSIIMPFPAVYGEMAIYNFPNGIAETDVINFDGDLSLGFSFSAYMKGPEESATLNVYDESGICHYELTVTYPFLRDDELLICTIDGNKTVKLYRGDTVTDLMGSTECADFPRLYPGKNYISFSDQAASLIINASPAYLNITEGL